MPTPPRNGLAAAGKVQFKTFDQYRKEAHRDLPPFQLPVSEDESLTVPCPTGAELLTISRAQRGGDLDTLVDTLFKDSAERFKELIADADFPVVEAVSTDVMNYYGQPTEDLGESSASSS